MLLPVLKRKNYIQNLGMDNRLRFWDSLERYVVISRGIVSGNLMGQNVMSDCGGAQTVIWSGIGSVIDMYYYTDPALFTRSRNIIVLSCVLLGYFCLSLLRKSRHQILNMLSA